MNYLEQAEAVVGVVAHMGNYTHVHKGHLLLSRAYEETADL